MNKKFSTLVAALLVTGGSFAMVSQYAGSALAESPLAMAAAANLRTASDTEQGEGASLQIVAGEAPVWSLSNEGALSAGGRNLFLNGSDLSLSVSKSSVVSIAENGKVMVGDKYLVIKNSALVVSGDADDAVALYNKDTKKVITAATATEAILGTWHADAAGELGSEDLAITGLTAPVTATLTTGDTGSSGILNYLNDNRVFELVGTTASFKIKLGEAYVKTNAAGDGIELTFDEDDAAACSFDANNANIVKVGEKYLSIVSENTISLASETTNAVKAYTSASAQVTTLPVTANNGKVALTKSVTASQPDVLIAAPTNMPVAPKITVEAAGDTPAEMTATAISVQGNDGFTLKIGEAYLAVDGENVTVSNAEGAAMFTSEAETNDVLYGGKHLTISETGLALVDELGDNTPVRAYGADNKAKAIAAGGQVVAAAVDNVEASYNPASDQCVSFELTAAVLKDGGVYAISNGSNGLSIKLGTNGYELCGVSTAGLGVTPLLRATNVTVNDVLWTVKKSTVGGEDFYAFTHVATGLPLAFSVAANGTASWGVEGDYDTFKIEGNHLTFKVNGNTYYIRINGTTAEATTTEATVTFGKAAPVETPESYAGVKAAVELLNKTYGTGNGFGLMFKDRALDEEKVKDVTLESNPFTDNTIITAVQGMNFDGASSTFTEANLSSKMFLKVSGSYPLTSANATVKDQLTAFRNSKFIAVDTIRYSKNISDAVANNFFKYTVVSGAEMITGNGVVYEGGSATDFERGGKYNGLTRRIENAEFTIKQAAGASVADPIEFIVDAYMPAADNGNKPALLGHSNPIYDLKINIKNFLGKNYVGAYATSWDYIYVGLNNDVDYQTINGIVTLTSRNYATDGQVYATNEAGNEVTTVLAKYVATDKPEGQFLATGGQVLANGTIAGFTFTNRESGVAKYFAGFKKTDKANVYASTNSNDTIEIKSASTLNEFDGYANYKKDVLENTQYVLKVVSNAAGIKDIYISEDHNKDHSLGLNADTLEAANFKLIKFEAGADMANYKDYGDTVFVSNEKDHKNLYSYVAVDKYGNKYYDVKEDRVVAFTYAIYNADNGEYLDVKNAQGSTLGNFYFCNPNKKYNTAKDADIQRFIIKEKANGAVQLIPVDVHATTFVGNNTAPDKVLFYKYDYTANTNKGVADSKLYAGISDNKLYKQGTIYKIADNDLFTIQQIGAPLYRTLDVTGNVRIYKEGMPNIALFAESADKALVSGQNLLGMEHKADADLNKTMFSFMVDTAYVDRANNYTPQYLLAIDATTTPGGKWCETHQSATCEHAVEIPGYVKGSYLVSLADSATAVAASQAHNNPYRYDGYNRLGFVKATHIGDKLAIERGKAVAADTLSLKDGLTKASFALRIVDQATQSFALQNADGYVKWLNGVPVLVGNFDQAEVLNIEATENAATANESIEAAGVQVIGGQGVVTVQGAAGKVITVANILGQTIANQVAASDNVTIAAPAGVVVVAVEGEATKVVVK